MLKVKKSKSLSHVQLFATPQTIQSLEFSRPEYWSGLPFASPRNLPNPGIKPRSPALQVDSLPAEPQGNTGVGRLSLFLPHPAIEPGSPSSQADSLPTVLSGKPIVLLCVCVFLLLLLLFLNWLLFPLTFVFFLPFLSITPECQSLTDLQLFFRFL